MSFKTSSVSALAVVVLSAASVSPLVLNAQQPQSGVHPITSLPLPPDDDDNPAAAAAAPPVQPLPAPAAAVAPKPAGTKPAVSAKRTPAKTPAVKPAAKPAPVEEAPATPAPITLPAPETPAVAATATPAVESPAPVTVPAKTPALTARHKPTPAPKTTKPLPAPVTTTTPEPEVVAPAVIAPPPASTPTPVTTPAVVVVKPAPETIAPPPVSRPTPAAEIVPAPAPPPIATPTAVPPPPVNADRAPVAPVAPVTTDYSMPSAAVRAATPVTLPAPIQPAEDLPSTAVAPTTITSPGVAGGGGTPAASVVHAPIVPVAPVVTSTNPHGVNAPTTVTMPAPIIVDSDGNASYLTPAQPTTVTPAPGLHNRPTAVSKPVTINLTAPPVDTTIKSGVVTSTTTPPAARVEAPPPPPPGTLGRILFQGADPYTQPELASLTGLVIGTRQTNDSLQAATQRLINSGLFANVSASYDTPHDVGVATFALQPFPTTLLRQVSFANIVWLTPEELNTALAQVPLYHGYVAATGGQQMIDSIQVALNHALAAKGIRATITHEDVAPSALHPYNAVEFRVIDPNVALGSASLFDIPPALVTQSLRIAAAAPKQPYNEGIAGTTLADILLAPERESGYVGARLWHIERKRRMVGSTTFVDFSARVDPGPIYTVRSVGWTPTPVLSDADFRRIAVLKTGQFPTADAAAKTEQAIQNAYYAQGYIEASVTATQHLDTKTGQADYAYSVAAGPQYHLRTVTAEGLSPEAKQDFETNWNLKPGDVYNEPYLLNFLNTHQNVPSFRGYVFSYNRAASTETHDVDLTLVFKHS